MSHDLKVADCPATVNGMRNEPSKPELFPLAEKGDSASMPKYRAREL